MRQWYNIYMERGVVYTMTATISPNGRQPDMETLVKSRMTEGYLESIGAVYLGTHYFTPEELKDEGILDIRGMDQVNSDGW